MSVGPLLTLPQVAASLPGVNGKPVAVSTVHRWITRGVPAAVSRTRVKLKGVRVGCKWCVRPADLAAFQEQLAEAHLTEEPAVGRPAQQRASETKPPRSVAKSIEALKALGA